MENGWLQENDAVNLVNERGVQLAAISYPHLSKEQIFHSMEAVLSSASISGRARSGRSCREMLGSWDMMKRRLREGVEFFRFLRTHTA